MVRYYLISDLCNTLSKSNGTISGWCLMGMKHMQVSEQFLLLCIGVIYNFQ